MIYTLTCNPSLDYMIYVTGFQMGKTNRTTQEQLVAGGKGINVSMMLKNLGWDSVCTGFVAGFTGEEIARQIKEMGLQEDFIRNPSGTSRINVKLQTGFPGGEDRISETELNGRGPEIEEVSLRQLRRKMQSVQNGDVLILSGSLPGSLPDTFYKSILEQLAHKDVKVVVDTAGDSLFHTLSYGPFLVKPNKQELEELYHVTIETDEELWHYGREIQLAGANNVLISLGEDGALLLTQNGTAYKADAPKGRLVNGVGAGDSMVAGFLVGYLETGRDVDAFAMAVAAGSASAFGSGFADREKVEELLPGIRSNIVRL